MAKVKLNTKDTTEINKDFSTNMSRGSGYLVFSLLVIFMLIYFIPEVLGFDISTFMQSKNIISILRILMGLGLFLGGLSSIRRAIAVSMVDDDTWQQGLKNVITSPILGTAVLPILLLLAGGIVLVVWGVSTLI